MLQFQSKPLYELTSCVKSGAMSCLLFGSVAGIHCVTTVFSSVQFLAYIWMYTADGVLCYITPLWRKENIRTNLCIQSGFPLKPKDLILLWRGRRAAQHFKLQRHVQLFSAVSSLLCLLLCEGMWRRPLPAWDLVTPLAASPASQASGESGRREEPVLSSGTSAQCTFNQTPVSSTGLNELVLDHLSLYCTMMTWKPDRVFKKPQWHQSLLLLHQAPSLAKPQAICLRHRSLKALFTGGRTPRWNLSSWATGILCLQYTTMSNISQN